MKSIVIPVLAAVTGSAAIAAGLYMSDANAQTPSAMPTFGEVSLSAGFTPDPFTIDLVAGGPIDAARQLGGNCLGFIADAPDFDLYYNSGSLPLILSAQAGIDTTLVIYTPEGDWICDDDSGPGVNPEIRLSAPSSGLYDIWVGSLSPDAQGPARLKISELDR